MDLIQSTVGALSKQLLAVGFVVHGAITYAGTQDLRQLDSTVSAQSQLSPSRSVQQVLLGHSLFQDRRLSANGAVSCSSCHLSHRAFTDGRPRAVGLNGQTGTRNAPSLINTFSETDLLWDGRVSSLEEQVRLPLFNSRELGLADDDQVKTILRSVPAYRARFEAAFGPSAQLNTDELARAIAAYERTLISPDSSFDRYWFGHQADAISADARRGLDLFRGRGGCSGCHVLTQDSAPLTDHQFHGSSIRLTPAVARDLPNLTATVIRIRGTGDTKALNELIGSDARIAALGRFLATLDPRDIGKFRTPSLRNVAVTSPYMHDGSIGSLQQAVQMELYTHTASNSKPVVVTIEEQTDLVEFLRTLTSEK
jgi:cytochrome c peroxidase